MKWLWKSFGRLGSSGRSSCGLVVFCHDDDDSCRHCSARFCRHHHRRRFFLPTFLAVGTEGDEQMVICSTFEGEQLRCKLKQG